MKIFFKRRAAVRAAKKFLKGYKCLTKNGEGRINGVVKAFDEYLAAVEKGKKVKLEYLTELVEKVSDIAIGLMYFKNGNEFGFKYFEDNKILDKLVEFINKKGRV